MKKLLCLILSLCCFAAALTSCANTQTTTATTSTTESTDQKTEITVAWDKIWFYWYADKESPKNGSEFEECLKKYRESRNLPVYQVIIYWSDGADYNLLRDEVWKPGAYKTSIDTFQKCFYVDISYDSLNADAVLDLAANENVKEIHFAIRYDAVDPD